MIQSPFLQRPDSEKNAETRGRKVFSPISLPLRLPTFALKTNAEMQARKGSTGTFRCWASSFIYKQP